MVLPWATPLDHFSLIFFYHFMKEIGSITVPLTSHRHYVDDCFLLFHSPSHIPLFLDFLNQHPNIKFTSEIESNNILPFSDVKINAPIDYFRLQFITNLLSLACLSISSFIPFSYKRSLILSLSHRFFNLCSNYENFHKELDTFKNIFKLSGSPTDFFDKCICLFLDKVSISRPLLHNVSQKVLYFCLPFVGTHSLQIHTQILSFCSSTFPHVNIHFIFSTLRTEFTKV